MQIPIKKLKHHLQSNTEYCKQTQSFDNSIVSRSIFGLLTKMINKFEHMTEYESGLFVQSLDKWLDRKEVVNKAENNLSVSVGDICMIDWSINYNPELSYVHPCLIIEDVNNMIFAVPVSSRQEIMNIAYHPIDNADGDKNYRKVGIPDGFLKDCVLFISEAKVISKSRIINKIGSLNCNLLDENGLFREIRWNMIKNYFSYEYSILMDDINTSHEKIDKLEERRRYQQSRADKNGQQIIALQNQIKELQEKIDMK